MSAVLAFNCGAASRQDVMKAVNISGGEFTFEGCKKKDAKRMRHSAKKAKSKDKERRRKIREAKLAVNQEKGETSSYASGKFNEADPLNFMESSSDEQSLSKVVGTLTVSRYICLSTIIQSKNLTSPSPRSPIQCWV